jgi:hypothetical protein
VAEDLELFRYQEHGGGALVLGKRVVRFVNRDAGLGDCGASGAAQ